MYERERQRRIGHHRTVCQFAHEQIVAHEQAFFHRRSRNDEHSEHIDADQRRHDRSEHDRLDPFRYFAVGSVGLLALLVFAPEQAIHVFRYVDVVDDGYARQQPRVAGPYDEPQRVKERNDAELDPAVAPYFLQFAHFYSCVFLLALRPFGRQTAFRSVFVSFLWARPALIPVPAGPSSRIFPFCRRRTRLPSLRP